MNMTTAAPEALLWQLQLDQQGGIIDEATHSQDIFLRWVHIQSDAPGALSLMRAIGLPENVIDALCANETRPRVVSTQQGTMLYLRGINRNPNADPEDMVSLRFWISDNLLVTARKKDRALSSVQEVKDLLLAKEGPKDIGGVICTLVEKIADKISETVDDISDVLSQFEEALSEGNTPIDRHELAGLRRKSAAIKRYLAPQRDALEALVRHRKFIDDAQTFHLREQTDRMTRYVEDLDLARERAVVLHEELRSQIADKQGLRMYVLSMVTAIFLPLSFLTGVFGMNVGGLPGVEEPDAFFYLSMCMLGLAVVGLVAMIWKKWL